MAGRWLEDGWEMAGRTLVVLEHPIRHTYHQYKQKQTVPIKQKRMQMAGCLALAISRTNAGVDLNRREMAARWPGS